jgi:hypothetical protein
MLVEDSSTNSRRSGSTPLRRSLKALLFCSFRSVAASVFFVGPPQLLSYGPAHRGDRYPNARLAFPHLAMALQSGVVVLFELFPQEALLCGGGEDAPLAPRGGARRKVFALPPFPKPAFERPQRDGEGLYHVFSGDAPLDRFDCPRPEIFRVDAHARNPRTRPLYSQTALDSLFPQTTLVGLPPCTAAPILCSASSADPSSFSAPTNKRPSSFVATPVVDATPVVV